MSKNVVIFNNDLFGSVRTLDIDDKYYFVASDVAKALGYAKPNNAINAHCKHIMKQGIVDDYGNEIQMNIISESDVYRLIIKSKLPEAEKFEEWVMEDVLPQLRASGVYITETATQESINYQSLYGKNRIYNTFYNSVDLEAEYNRFYEMSKAERKARHINNDTRIECSKLIQKALGDRLAANVLNPSFPTSKLLAMRELSEKIQVDITKLSNKANGGVKAHLTKQIKAQQQRLEFMETELIQARTQYEELEQEYEEYRSIQDQGADTELIEIDYYGFSNNAMYKYQDGKVKRTAEYNQWINHFPMNTISHLSEEVDFDSPMACELYFDHDKRFDVHNFIKPMLDMISRATGKDDKNIRKVSCVTNELVDNHRHDGKIYMKLYNIELDAE